MQGAPPNLLNGCSPISIMLHAASVAGLLMSFRVAIPMAPLYVRGMYQVVQGIVAWDHVLQLPQACRLDLEWWLQHAPEVNGSRMGKGLAAFQVDYTAVVDTSHYRHAATVTDGTGSHCDRFPY
jgi:hypothetical protein